MPSGGSTALADGDWEFIKQIYEDACKHGLQYEWLQWFAGGIAIDHLPVREAAVAAAIEWDF